MKLLACMASVIVAASFAAAQTARCDRACLEGFVDQYMNALVAHDPSTLPVARGVRNTENGQRLELGDGFWNTATGKGSYRLFVTDVTAGQVAFMGTMKEADAAVAVASRLKVVNRQIAEIETFVVRGGLNNTLAGTELEKLGKPDELFTTEIAPAERATREDLVRVANMYFSGLEKNDGQGLYPFADDCDRLENGVRTTNNPHFRTGSGFASTQASPINPATMSCKAAFESGYFNFVTRIRDRRFVAVDVERGLVFSFVFFDHAAGKYRTFKLSDGRDITTGPTRPWTWEIAEMFRIEKGRIRRVEALLEQVPYGMLSGWSNWDEGMSSRQR
jgi:hypothetical protein